VSISVLEHWSNRIRLRRKRAKRKKPTEAMRCLKRRISDAIYRQLVADAWC
jgi:transposase